MTRVIAITGASSGLGRALALEYSAPGVVLALIGRDALRLEEAAAQARAKGASVRIGKIDVRDRAALRAFLLAIDAADSNRLPDRERRRHDGHAGPWRRRGLDQIR